MIELCPNWLDEGLNTHTGFKESNRQTPHQKRQKRKRDRERKLKKKNETKVPN